jgi:hypothetical protein
MCFRYPPTAFIINVGRDTEGKLTGTEQVSQVPVVAPDWFCGEWTTRPINLDAMPGDE